jgi:dihydropyrimidinase
MYTFGVHAGRITLNQWVETCSTGPARLFGLYPRKGSLAVGADADIVLFDPEKAVTLSADLLHENVDYTPYEGFELRGYPLTTLAHGQVIVQDRRFVGEKAQGSFLHRNPFTTQ